MLRIVFTGLCAFVDEGSSLQVVVPNFTHATHGHGHDVPMHVSYIKFPRSAAVTPALDGSGNMIRPPSFSVTSPTTQKESYVLLLAGETLSIVPESGSIGSYAFNARRIIEMKEIVEFGELDPSLLGRTSASGTQVFQPSYERVAALLTIAGGNVAAAAGPTDTLAFRSQLKKKVYIGDFAEEVLWDLPDGKYVFRSRRNDDDTGTISTQWKFDATANLVCEIGCIPLEDLVEPESPALAARDHEEIDHHFPLLYDLCAIPPAEHPLPRRVSIKPLTRRALGVNCPPVLFGS